jgi:hypothetical protein
MLTIGLDTKSCKIMHQYSIANQNNGRNYSIKVWGLTACYTSDGTQVIPAQPNNDLGIVSNCSFVLFPSG